MNKGDGGSRKLENVHGRHLRVIPKTQILKTFPLDKVKATKIFFSFFFCELQLITVLLLFMILKARL